MDQNVKHVADESAIKVVKRKEIMIIKQKRIYREDLINNPDFLYLFGDNVKRIGYGGQAKEMRGEPNALGIATKKTPSSDPLAFFYDDEYMKNVKIIYDDMMPAVKHLVNGGVLVIPADGLGTGLSKMDKKCPRTLMALNELIEYLYNVDERMNPQD